MLDDHRKDEFMINTSLMRVLSIASIGFAAVLFGVDCGSDGGSSSSGGSAGLATPLTFNDQTTVFVPPGTVYKVVRVTASGFNCPRTLGVSGMLSSHQSVDE